MLRRVAQGGMSDVWASVRLDGGEPPRLAAVKTPREGTAASAERVTMLLDEGRVSGRILHPNVCRTVEIVVEASEVFLVMEWIEGVSLADLLSSAEGEARERVSFSVGARIVRDVAAGLHAAHEAVDDVGKHLGVVHRDVSPDNILVGTDGRVCVSDFGVARARGKLHATLGGQLKGKVGYLAPEQIIGTAVDRRTDLFALGMVLYEATTGFRPFHTKDGELPLVRRALAADYRKPSAHDPAYPPRLADVIERALQRDPAARFASALDMCEALDQYLEGAPAAPRDLASIVSLRRGRALADREGDLQRLARASHR
jgi:serine/threonine protein kinase